MQSSAPTGEVLSALVARFGAGSDVAPHGAGGSGGWVVTLAAALGLIVVGSVAARLARRLVDRSTPELVNLLNQSATFYGRWPEDRLQTAPGSELAAEAARCRRTIELLESHGPAGTGRNLAMRGPVDGLNAWITLLHKHIANRVDTSPGLSHA
ncbi:MAG: hypothetical protein M3O32_03560 [Actinomycetota bacterium]|nr:hypothetical protein [Actinomycetota bacterium]